MTKENPLSPFVKTIGVLLHIKHQNGGDKPQNTRERGQVKNRDHQWCDSLSKKSNINLTASIGILHEDSSQRVEDESTETHYVSKFIFKANNTLSITKVLLNKDLEKSQDLEADTLKIKIGEVETTRVERIKDITRLAKEPEESQEKLNPKEGNTPPRPYHLRDKLAAEEQGTSSTSKW